MRPSLPADADAQEFLKPKGIKRIVHALYDAPDHFVDSLGCLVVKAIVVTPRRSVAFRSIHVGWQLPPDVAAEVQQFEAQQRGVSVSEGEYQETYLIYPNVRQLAQDIWLDMTDDLNKPYANAQCILELALFDVLGDKTTEQKTTVVPELATAPLADGNTVSVFLDEFYGAHSAEELSVKQKIAIVRAALRGTIPFVPLKVGGSVQREAMELANLEHLLLRQNGITREETY